MEFDCYTALRIEGKPYIIAEKIRYKEKTSDDTWTEYGLVAEGESGRQWLSVSDGGLSCSLSSPVQRTTPPKGYRMTDKGTEVVVGVWGDSDASVGDEAPYFSYKSADGESTFFVEEWDGMKSASSGRSIASAEVCVDTDASPRKVQTLRWAARKRFVSRLAQQVVMAVAGICLLSFLLSWFDDDFRWHDVRNFFGAPYTLSERLSDAPYYTEAADEGSDAVYTARIDAASAALDLIEGVDGRTQEAYQDTGDAAQTIVIRTAEEVAHLTNTSEGTAHIAISSISSDATSASDQQKRNQTLARYAELIRTEGTRGRDAVVLETQAAAPAAVDASSAAPDAVSPSSAPPTAAPAPSSESPSRKLRIKH